MTRIEAIPKYILALSCPSAPGQVAAIAGFLEERGSYIDEISVFDDSFNQTFFVRCVFHAAAGGALPLQQMKADFQTISEKFSMTWSMTDAAVRARVLIMVSKLDHCLNDLIYRWRMGELKIDIAAVVSNHPDLEPVATSHGIPFFCLPVTPQNKREPGSAGALHADSVT